MSVRRKVLIIIAAACVGLMGVVFGVARSVILGNARHDEPIFLTDGRRNGYIGRSGAAEQLSRTTGCNGTRCHGGRNVSTAVRVQLIA